jgi:hypothetical protein
MSADTAGTSAVGLASTVRPRETETSVIGRVVVVLTPFFVIAAGWIAGLVARRVPGANLDQAQIVTFMTATATSVLAVAWKWLRGWQQHELLVAEGRARAPGMAPPPAGTSVQG